MSAEEVYINPYQLFVGSFIPNWLLRRREVSQGAKLCYARLCQYAGRHGEAFPHRSEIAAEIGVSERSVDDYIKELRHASLITIVRHGLGQTNSYRFLRHDWMFENPMDLRPPQAQKAPESKASRSRLAESCESRVEPPERLAESCESGLAETRDSSPADSCKSMKEENHIKENQRSTLNVPGPAAYTSNRQSPIANDADDTPRTYAAIREREVARAVALTGDQKSERRFRQLFEIAFNAGWSSAWDVALKSLGARLERGEAIRSPGAYLCATLLRLLEDNGVPVPAGTLEERAEVRALMARSLQKAEKA